MVWLGLEGKQLEFVDGNPTLLIGERLNPTGNKAYAKALRMGDYDFALIEAKKQVACGAVIIDVNVGLPGLNEEEALVKVVQNIQRELDIPLCLDSSNPKAIEKALLAAKGRLLINSVNGKTKSMNEILPLVRDYDTMAVALCFGDDGINFDEEKRLAPAYKLLNVCLKMGIDQERLLLDPLVLSAGSNPAAGQVFINTLTRLKKELQVKTVAGISNVSFGLPNREEINASFLTMAIASGLDAAIIDPTKAKIVETMYLADMLANRKNGIKRYLEFYQKMQSSE